MFWSIPYQLRIIAKDSLGRFPVLGPHLKRTGHMLVDRSRPDRAGIVGWASRLTSNGLSLIVFPEGTRSRTGMLGKFKGGSIMLAMQAGLPLVPISVVGSRHVMKKGELTTKPGYVRVIVHDPIATGATEHPSTRRRARAGRSRARKSSGRLWKQKRPIQPDQAAPGADGAAIARQSAHAPYPSEFPHVWRFRSP